MKKTEQKSMMCGNQYVALGSSLAGIYLVICIMFLIFAPINSDALVDIAWAFVVLGVFLGYFTYRSGKK